MTPQPSERLSGAVIHLHRAVNALTAPQTRYLNNQAQSAPSAYQQLRDTITGMRNSGYNGGHQSQPNIWVDAFDLLNEIDTAAECWYPQLDGIPPTIGRLQALAVKGVTGNGWRPQDLRPIGQITKACEIWVQQINNLLDPESIKHLRAPDGEGYAACPSCDRRTTYRVDPSDGDRKRVPVLQWVSTTGTTCIVCKAHWLPERTPWLARVIGFELPDVFILE